MLIATRIVSGCEELGPLGMRNTEELGSLEMRNTENQWLFTHFAVAPVWPVKIVPKMTYNLSNGLYVVATSGDLSPRVGSGA